MSMTQDVERPHTIVANVLAKYHQGLRALTTLLNPATADLGLTWGSPPPLAWPDLDGDLADFLSVSDMSLHELGSHRGARLVLLNLMRNPGTRTVKTFGSLGIVARAVNHIRCTGERVCLFTATSGNKGTALRDAVGRAIGSGLTTPDKLRVVMVAPSVSYRKLRGGTLSEDATLRSANPAVLAEVDVPVGVKDLAREAGCRLGAQLREQGWLLWYTLGLDNYRMSDATRAFVEAEFLPITVDGPPRVHAHAVSGAWGLLGYHFGHGALGRSVVSDLSAPASHPGFLLVQHLATPEMVLSQAHGAVDPAWLPRYELDSASGLWRQESDPLFPSVTDDPRENIDATFYTTAPPTMSQVDEIIRRHGGGGIVVSRQECLAHYDAIRALVAPCGIDLPARPDELREWSVVMTLTGVLLALDRDLLPPGVEVVVHGTGAYCDRTLPPLPSAHTVTVRGVDDLVRVVRDAVSE